MLILLESSDLASVSTVICTIGHRSSLVPSLMYILRGLAPSCILNSSVLRSILLSLFDRVMSPAQGTSAFWQNIPSKLSQFAHSTDRSNSAPKFVTER